jgi:glycosyltransferase involved in cell wall biosynthesis
VLDRPEHVDQTVVLFYSSITVMGGGERQWAEELRALRAKGVHAIGLVQEHSSTILRQLGVEGEVLRQLPKAGVSMFGRIATLQKWLRLTRPGILIAHTSPELIYLATRGTGIPYVLYQNDPPFLGGFPDNPYPFARLHGQAYRTLATSTPGYREFLRPPNLNAAQQARIELRAYLKKRALRSAAAVVVLSRRAAAEIQHMYGVDAVVLRGCLDERLSSWKPRTQPRHHHRLGSAPLFMSICRLVEEKRVDVLLRAFPMILAAVPGARLVIGGVGPEAYRLEQLADELQIRHAVTFVGYVDQEVVWDYYAAADVFVAPAAADFNIAPYEALALGRKVVVSDELEVEDFIRHSGRLFTAPPTPAGMAAQAVAALRALPMARLDLSQLTWSARAEKLLNLLRTLGWGKCKETSRPGRLTRAAKARTHVNE